ncbi:unnamed protein product [Rotaria sp. Silwood2]|nr:unnamed protein product [Rotaria sp. Silwood2]
MYVISCLYYTKNVRNSFRKFYQSINLINPTSTMWVDEDEQTKSNDAAINEIETEENSSDEDKEKCPRRTGCST